MTGKEIVQALRCCAEGECKDCAIKEAVFRPDGLAPRKNITHWMPLPGAPEAHNGKENS